jgi:hypothetical protein
MDTTAAIDTTNKITPDPVVPATSAADTTKTDATTTPATTTSTATKDSSAGTFETFLKAQLANKTAGNVSEEELFSALIGQRIEALKDSETATKYTSALSDNKKAMAKADGFVPCEDAAKKSLAGLRESGVLTKEEADKIYSEAFAGAQLDSNKDALFDDRGGAGDTTISTAEFAKAMETSKAVMDQIAAGTLTVTARSLDEASNGKSAGVGVGAATGVTTGGLALAAGTSNTPDGTKFDGDGGFLWKPISNNQNKLAVLLPNDFKYQVSGVTVLDASGVVLDSGTSTGYGDDGEREKFSFNKTGGDYGDNLTVNVAFMDGTHIEYKIPDGSKRYD